MTVVVLRALGLGDLLTAVPALRGLRRAFPDRRVVLAAPVALGPLARLSGAVDEVVGAAPLAPLDERLHRAEVAVNLHGRGPESSALLAATRPGRLLAFRHPEVASTAGGPAWSADEHEVARWCRLLAHFGVPADPADLHLTRPDGPVDPDHGGATVIHPGAASGARRWPVGRWVEVARAEHRAGRRVVVTGSAGERHLAEAVARGAGLRPAAVLAGRTDLLGLASVVAWAGRVVCGDTGMAHLASAFGTPSVVLFGPTPPARWGPPSGPHRVLWRGRVGDPHGPTTDPGLAAITVDEVLDALAGLPHRDGSVSRPAPAGTVPPHG